MNSETIRIIAAVVDTRHLKLYLQSGDHIEIPQGDHRIQEILDTAIPQIARQGYADINLKPASNTYSRFEEQSNGVVKFFRVAREKLKRFFNPEADKPQATATISTVFPAKVEDGPEDSKEQSKEEHLKSAVSEIISQAIPVADPNFTEDGLIKQGVIAENNGNTNSTPTAVEEAAETIVAVVGNKIIPGMELIKTQFERAAKLGSTKGVENFLKRLGAVIQQRSHSVDDLLKFMERGDLPIADDGSILIYKVLNRVPDELGKYKDCHTGKVKQWLGAYVCMDHSLVDHNRNNECSNGLHVARRGYIRQFGGDVCVMAKLAPEDVIAVPSYDANKMRVCGYHIIFELTDAQYRLLNSNQALTEDPDGKVLLAKALAGDHIGKTHEVRITKHMGGDVVVTKLKDVAEPVQAVKATEEPAMAEDEFVEVSEGNEPKPEATAEALQNPTEEALAAPVDPKAVAAKAQSSRKEEAAKLVAAVVNAQTPEQEVEAWATLKEFKKLAKVGWDKLGVDPKLVARLENKKAAPAKASKKSKASKVVKTPAPVKAKTPHVPMPVVTEGSHKERIAKLLAIGLDVPDIALRIIEIKQKAKKSWEVLGVSEAQVKAINKAAGV